HAALIELDGMDIATTRAMSRAILRLLEDERPREIVDFSAAFDRVLIEFRHGEETAALASKWTRRFSVLEPLEADASTLHEIPVVYDGEDLAELAARHDLDVGEVIARHTAPIYDVVLLGFSPGFPYLAGLDPRLVTPRRASPRPKVPAGSVAIGGSHTGIYSIESPGGWHLLGTTPVRVFDPARREPGDEAMFLLKAGDRVKFHSVE
ncbi:MAG TPA: 5-oxoprolinase subunit PxpB, partial [Chthoniobacterales bacterium]|nr:5-oxoprolinase subunit PxpB [Chthoniobacterales bacterium]